ncbi:alpha-glucoside-specific PTS transporter subunit IIBC [Lacticaseibacillus paracasei]|uniref:alpha-glucoside-specific PTS transporter subunit IIBC n=1 Tax=Lacticaseibacillus paracasei TaxID=1597 RepID=UPI003091722B|nr:alpha-glucoside-specific PTS transporter subunit IIBC [Lacticaseibacillus paracasei]WQG45949.1 alpha-glucoside-specific PTS transporter subunit IIBC [Lacticaseibacillus casei]
MMQKLQRFGAAMFTPVLLFTFAGIMTAICILMTNEQIFGSMAAPGTNWYGVWQTLQAGAFTVFNIIPLLFVVGLPIGLAKQAPGRAAMEAVVIYASWNYMINAILTNWGTAFGFKNFAKMEIVANSTNQGLTNIIGIKTLDTSIVGALIVAGIVVWLHNRYFDTKLPDWLGTFQGSSYIVILGLFIMIPLAVLTCFFWPKVQMAISALQGFMKASGVFGIWVYAFLERVLIPTGLHHFIYIPFEYGPAAVSGGLKAWWFANLNTLGQSTRPIKELAPLMGFEGYGFEKVFGMLGIGLGLYATAKPSKKKETAALLIPAVLTGMFAGITEPVEFTFLFAAPVLWFVHAFLAATMDAIMFAVGVVGEFSGGLIGWASENWIPLWNHQWKTYLLQIAIGLVFVVIYYVAFKYLILKFNFVTPGREPEDQSAKLMTKKEYKAAKAAEKGASPAATDPYTQRAIAYLSALGGSDNIKEMTSCATRLRVTVNDETKVAPDAEFKANKAVNVVHHGKALQVIVGLDVPQVLEKIQGLLDDQDAVKTSTVTQPVDDSPESQTAALLSDSLGTGANVQSAIAQKNTVVAKVNDPSLVDPASVFKSLGIGVKDVQIDGTTVTITFSEMSDIANRIMA